MASNTVILDVSGRKFRTTKSVLSVSPHFESLLTRWNDCADLQADGSYYIDADQDTFEHLLNFIRRPAQFPLYWPREDGFDYVLYSKLEAEADYFMLESLRDWIQAERYLGAVMVHRQQVRDNIYSSCADVVLQNFLAHKTVVTLSTRVSLDPDVLINTKL
jgi:hypothetical protein